MVGLGKPKSAFSSVGVSGRPASAIFSRMARLRRMDEPLLRRISVMPFFALHYCTWKTPAPACTSSIVDKGGHNAMTSHATRSAIRYGIV